MGLKRITNEQIGVLYMDLGGHFGFYRVRPGKEPYICLNEKLLEGGEGVHLNVYRVLLDYHNSVPPDSPYRLFPLIRYYEELLEVVYSPTPAIPEPEIVIIGFASRRWRFPVYLPDNYRLIG